MNTKYFRSAFIGAAAALGAIAYSQPAIVVHPSNTQPLPSDSVNALLVGKQRFWADGSEIEIVVVKNDAEAEKGLLSASGMDENRFKNHWQRLAFSGRGRMPTQVDSSSEATAIVKSNPKAIAIVDSAGLAAGELRILD